MTLRDDIELLSILSSTSVQKTVHFLLSFSLSLLSFFSKNNFKKKEVREE